MSSDTKTRTIILVDLVGSSSKVTNLEIEQGEAFLHDATQPIEDAILAHDGVVIKFTGDGYFGTFESADDALEAADDIRSHFMRQRYTPGGIMLDGVRIVVNTADIVVEDDDEDIVGDGVIVTARLEKHVPTNSIWVTAATREVCSNTIFNFEAVGDFNLKGRNRPVTVYELQDTEASYVENDIVLVITDLHNYVALGESLPPDELNNWLMKWSNLHREAVQGIKGRVRQFVADMSLLTFTTPDEAYHALLNLKALVHIHNQNSELPDYQFKAAIEFGSLVLSPTGIVGPLVNEGFTLLNETPREHISISEDAYQRIKDYRGHFTLRDGVRIALPRQEDL